MGRPCICIRTCADALIGVVSHARSTPTLPCAPVGGGVQPATANGANLRVNPEKQPRGSNSLPRCSPAPTMTPFQSHGRTSQANGAALFCVLALCVCQGCRGLQVWTGGGVNGQNAAEFSVPLVLLLTDTGVAQTGANGGATLAPAAGPEDDNSLGYTGTAAASRSAGASY